MQFQFVISIKICDSNLKFQFTTPISISNSNANLKWGGNYDFEFSISNIIYDLQFQSTFSIFMCNSKFQLQSSIATSNWNFSTPICNCIFLQEFPLPFQFKFKFQLFNFQFQILIFPFRFSQYCDVHVNEIQEMLAKLPNHWQGTKCHDKRGWLPIGFSDQCREIINRQVRAVLRKQMNIPEDRKSNKK